jgi:glucans biosynthesis protein C
VRKVLKIAVESDCVAVSFSQIPRFISSRPMIDDAHTTTRPERRHDVDLMRALLVLGLILFHTARIFDLLPFYVKNDEKSLTLMTLVGFVSQWGMPLFFVIAGIAAWHSLAKRTPAEFARDRFKRLIVPLVFGICVLVPPQHYYNLRTNPEYHDSYWQFYPSFFRVVLKFDFPDFIRADPAVGIFGPAHLWFLYYLFAFSMVSLPLFIYLRGDAGLRLVSRLAAFCQKPGAIFLMALPVILIETLYLTEETTGWNRYAYIPFLLCGYLFAADDRFERSLCRHRNVGLVAGTLTVIGFFAVSVVTYQAGRDPSRGYAWDGILWRLLKSCSSFLWIVAILGFAHRYKHRQTADEQNDSSTAVSSKDGDWQSVQHWNRHRSFEPADKVRQYVNEAVMPFYIIHQTVIVVIGFYAVKWKTGVAMKYLLISTATFVVTLFLFELIRRTNPTRFLFGMKPMR